METFPGRNDRNGPHGRISGVSPNHFLRVTDHAPSLVLFDFPIERHLSLQERAKIGHVDRVPRISSKPGNEFDDVSISSPPGMRRATLPQRSTAVMWDKENLYVGFWVEEPMVRARFTKRDSPIYQENDVEFFITGKDAYYEFEINAMNTVYEVFFIWEEAYERGGFDVEPLFRRSHPNVRGFGGVGFRNHPRGPRRGSWDWDFPGLQTAVYDDGTLNKDHDCADPASFGPHCGRDWRRVSAVGSYAARLRLATGRCRRRPEN